MESHNMGIVINEEAYKAYITFLLREKKNALQHIAQIRSRHDESLSCWSALIHNGLRVDLKKATTLVDDLSKEMRRRENKITMGHTSRTNINALKRIQQSLAAARNNVRRKELTLNALLKYKNEIAVINALFKCHPVLAFDVVDNWLIVYTDVITILHEGSVYELGIYKLSVEIGGAELQRMNSLYSTHRDPAKNLHPNGCIDFACTLIYNLKNAQEKGDYVRVFEYMFAWLQSIARNHSAADPEEWVLSKDLVITEATQ